MYNGNSAYNGGSNYCFMAADDPKIKTMAGIFYRQVPKFQCLVADQAAP